MAKKYTLWRFLLSSLLVVGILAVSLQGVSADEQNIPSESECRPYIEKALKDLGTADSHAASAEDKNSSEETDASVENDSKEDSGEADAEVQNDEAPGDDQSSEEVNEPEAVETVADSLEAEVDDSKESAEDTTDDGSEETEPEERDGDSGEDKAEETQNEIDGDSIEVEEELKDEDDNVASNEEEDKQDSGEDLQADEPQQPDDEDSKENDGSQEGDDEGETESLTQDDGDDVASSKEEESTEQGDVSTEESRENDDSKEEGEIQEEADVEGESDSKEETVDDSDSKEKEDEAGDDGVKDDSSEQEEGEVKSRGKREVEDESEDAKSIEEESEGTESTEDKETDEKESEEKTDIEEETATEDSVEELAGEQTEESGETEEGEESSEMPEEDLLMEIDIPENLRSRDHVSELLRLDEESTVAELLIEKSADTILRQLKGIYDNAIKPLEILYRYRDLSNRHFGDPEIFSKPLVLFMGPWSGGKSSLINYLTENEFTEWSLRTGAEPSPAYFNILMHGEEPQVLDGTQLAADWTFSGLQKFGQGLEERLRGVKLPNKLLEKVNIVEIPGILEVRKQVSRVFPFNDACQWFIDRADVIFLVYDPSKLDIGPETEAILDQLKGRESQTRIILNKADQVKPEELMRVQGALIWNISPLMSSSQPPVMYTTSLWSMPYEVGAPVRLLQAQERAFLKDLRTAIDKRIENKIASARRFAVRVRNHAKMVDCYLTTYYNHKTIFGNKKIVAEAIIEHPQNYHIYEGLSTLTNISRYDLPDPETYRDFFRLNPLYEFQQLSATCTYFRGCPINRLDVAIAYDLPELVGRYKKMVETATPQGMPKS